jgi:hypothetical protein
MVWKMNTRVILVGNEKVKRPLEHLHIGGEDNTKVDLGEI